MLIKQYRVVMNERRQPELLKERSFRYSAEQTINNPQKVANLLREIGAADAFEESFYLLAFNSKLKLTGLFEVFRGATTYCAVEPSAIFRRAMLVGAHSIIIAHNHPSGDTTPSEDDISLTKRIDEGGKILEIQLLDHVIVGDDYFSMKENGVI